ncbi:MAG: MBG domain-containing protein, partial [Bacillota bacterium]
MSRISIKKVSFLVIAVLVLTLLFALFAVDISVMTNSLLTSEYAATTAEAATTTSDYILLESAEISGGETSGSSDSGSWDDGSSYVKAGGASVTINQYGEATAVRVGSGGSSSPTTYTSDVNSKFATSKNGMAYASGNLQTISGLSKDEYNEAVSNGNIYYKLSFITNKTDSSSNSIATKMAVKISNDAKGYGYAYITATGYSEANTYGIVGDSGIDIYSGAYGILGAISTSGLAASSSSDISPSYPSSLNYVQVTSDNVNDDTVHVYAGIYGVNTSKNSSSKVTLVCGIVATVEVYYRPTTVEYSSYSTTTGTVSAVYSSDTSESFSSNSSYLGFYETASLTATPSTDYSFLGWYDASNKKYSDSNPLTTAAGYSIDASSYYKAYFYKFDYPSSSTLIDGIYYYTYSGSPQGPEIEYSDGTATSGTSALKLTLLYTGTNETSYGPTSTAPTDAGTYSVKATICFASDESIDATSDTLSFIIQKATISADDITVSLGDIEYGETVSDAAINEFIGTATFNGTTIAGSMGTITAGGTQIPEVKLDNSGNVTPTAVNITTTFTPDDTANFNSTTLTAVNVSITVAKNTPTFEFSLDDIYYGKSLSDSTVKASATNSKNSTSVEDYYDASVAGNYIIYTSAGVKIAQYNGATGIWTYYDASSGNTTTTAYKPENGNKDDNLTYTIAFVPHNTTNYNTISYDETMGYECTLTVNKLTPTATASLSEIYYGQTYNGQTYNELTISGSASVGGVFTLDETTFDSSTLPYNGEKISVTFTPTDSDNYEEITIEDVSITVNQTTPTVSFEYTGDDSNTITYGTLLEIGGTATNKYSDSSVAGTYTFKWYTSTTDKIDDNGILSVGTYQFYIVFTPTDITNYESVISNQYTVDVTKASVTVTSIAASGITYGKMFSDSTITATVKMVYCGDTYDVTGTFEWYKISGVSIYMPNVSDSGTYAITFTAESITYNSATFNLSTDNVAIYYGSAVLNISKAETPSLITTDLADANTAVSKEDSSSSNAEYQIAYDNTITFTFTSDATIKNDSATDIKYIDIAFTISNSKYAEVLDNGITKEIEDGKLITTITVYIKDGVTGSVTFTAQLDTSSGNYESFPTSTITLQVKQPQTIGNFSDIEVTYGSGTQPLYFDFSSGLDSYSIESTDENVITVLNKTITIVGAGEAYVTVTNAGNTTYAAVTGSIKVTISQASLTVTVVNQTITYGTGKPTFTYTYSGLKNGESAGDVITEIENDYTGESTPDAGEYIVSVTSITSANYKLTSAVSGTITVQQATLTAKLNTDIEKVYGAELPDLKDIIDYYTGYISSYGDSSETVSLTSSPTIDYNGLSKSSSVDTYYIYLSGGGSTNYVIESATVTIKVTGAAVKISLGKTSVNYNGSQQTVKATVEGISGLSEPSAEVTYYYMVASSNSTATESDSAWSKDAPTNAGTYDVMAVYADTAEKNDNYIATTLIVEDAITILPVNPTFKVTGYTVTYNGSQQSPSSITMKGEAEYTFDPSAFTVTYYYGETTGYTDDAPTDAGEYTIKLAYTGSSNYNEYTDTSYTFTINKAEVTFKLETVTANFSGSAVNVTASVYGVNDLDLTDDVSVSDLISYTYYSVATASYVDPINAGSYHVTVKFSGNTNYAETEDTEFNCIVINKKDLVSLSLTETSKISMIYTGIAYEFSATATGVTIGGTTFEPTGKITFQYMLSSSTTGIYTTSAVTNVGLYNVKVVYTTIDGDNYNSYEVIYGNYLEITQATPTITMDNYSSYVYNGSGYAVTAKINGVVGGTTPEGSFTYTYAYVDAYTDVDTLLFSSNLPINVGTYWVKVTFTATSSGNYVSITDAYLFEDIMTISAAKPSITIDYVEVEFDGSYVTTTAYIVGASDTDSTAP